MKYVGIVEENEKEVICDLFEKKIALENLLKIINLNETSIVMEKILDDYKKTSFQFEQWWSKMSKKYSWEYCEEGYWSIDFETNKIYLNANC